MRSVACRLEGGVNQVHTQSLLDLSQGIDSNQAIIDRRSRRSPVARARIVPRTDSSRRLL
jgi:hypothetical protein